MEFRIEGMVQETDENHQDQRKGNVNVLADENEVVVVGAEQDRGELQKIIKTQQQKTWWWWMRNHNRKVRRKNHFFARNLIFFFWCDSL